MTPSKHEMLAWEPKGHVTPPSAQEIALPNDTETAFFNDHRRRVEREDLEWHMDRPGKYRSIVKLRLVYLDPNSSQKRYFRGTGWLIASKDLVVTAAHAVCDRSINSLVWSVEAQVGCNGGDSIANLQRRLGAKVLIPKGWHSSDLETSRLYDFAFIKLETPFNDVLPLKYANTPLLGKRIIGVVGYPGDKGNGAENGSQMYEQFDEVGWNVRNTGGLLTYSVSTAPGNSGSPVLLETGSGLVAIATHTGGYDIYRNRASPIGTQPFNSYHKIIERFFSGTWPEPDSVWNLPNLNVEVHHLTGRPTNAELHDKHPYPTASSIAEMAHNPMLSDSKTPDADLSGSLIWQKAALAVTAMLGMLGWLCWYKELSTFF